VKTARQKEATTRCPERSTERAQCIHEAGHAGRHFAKDNFAYYSWRTRQPKKRGLTGWLTNVSEWIGRRLVTLGGHL
jgi:hypothetical protein